MKPSARAAVGDAGGTAGLRSLGRGGLGRIVASFPAIRVAVLGDFFLDKYLEVDPGLAEISLETGKTAHQVVSVRHSPGAAGTVVCNLAALGVRSIRAIGLCGDDGEGYELRSDLDALGCDHRSLHIDRGRHTPTYLKPRDRGSPGLEGEHSRYDSKNHVPTGPEMEARILRSIDEALPELDALIVVDQVAEPGMGVLTRTIVDALPARLASFPRLVAFADSRKRIHDFRGLILKMNQFELAGITDPEAGSSLSESLIESALPRVARLSGKAVFATAAERGVWTFATTSGVAAEGNPPLRVGAVRVEGPIDPTGAGDSFTAGAVLALAAGASLPEAALVGNLVASVTVRQLATTGTARPEELFPAYDLWLKDNP